MIKEALQYLAGLATKADTAVGFYDENGQRFATRQLHRIPETPPVPEVHPVNVHTLRALCDYLNTDPDEVIAEGGPGAFVSVLSPTEVAVYTPVLGESHTRQHYAHAEAIVPWIRLDEFVSLAAMAIMLRTCFVESEERDELVSFLGLVVETSSVKVADDGVTQTVAAKRSLGFKEDAPVPGIVNLAPRTTFSDVAQVERPFVVRVESRGEGRAPEVALFEADGGAWRREAVENVAVYIRENSNVNVLA